MSQSHITSVNSQVNGHLSMMTFILVLVFLFVFSVAHLKKEQLNQQYEDKLSQLKQQVSYQQTLIKASKLLDKILSDKQANNFQQDNQKLMTHWSILNGVLASNSPQSILWLADNQKNQDLVTRIMSFSEDNRQLLIQTVKELKKMSEILTDDISKKNRQLKKLYQLVAKDSVNDLVTVNRAKTHIKATTTLENLNILNQAFETTIDGFEQLSIKTSSIKFEELSQQVLTTLALHQALTASSMSQVNEHVEVLKLLLLVEQGTVAKWRSYLRLINEYRTSLQKQSDALHAITGEARLNDNQYVRIKNINEENLYAQINQILTVKQQMIIFWLIIIVFFLSFIYLVISLSQKVKANQHKNIEVFITDLPKNVSVKKRKFESIIDEVLTIDIPKNVSVQKRKFKSIIDEVLTTDIPKNVSVKKRKFKSIIDEVLITDIPKNIKVKRSEVKGIIEENKTYFDMALYTQHHGTFELASYMLDEYIASNDESFKQLCNAIAAKNKSSAEQALMVLIQNARILAAEKLIALTLQLEKVVVKQTFNKIGEILLLTKYELAAIKKYVSST